MYIKIRSGLRFFSIKYKLMVSIILIIISLCTSIMYLWYDQTTKSTEKSTIANIDSLISTMNNNFNDTLEYVRLVLSGLSVNKDILNALSSINESSSQEELHNSSKQVDIVLSGLYGFWHKYMKSIIITNLENFQANFGLNRTDSDLRSIPGFNKIDLQAPDTFILPPHTYEKSRTPNAKYDYSNAFISMVRPVKYGEATIGLLAVDISYSVFSDVLNSSAPNNGFFIVYDKTLEQYIYVPETPDTESIITDRNLKKIISGFNAEKGSASISSGGKNYFAIFNYSPFTKWTTVYLVPKDILFADLKSSIKKAAVFSSVLMIIFIGITFFFNNIITKKLICLSKTMKAFDYSKLDSMLEIKSNDEIGYLYQQYNNMLGKIKELIDNNTRIQNEKRQSDMKALSAQINPHFLFNTLNTIKFLSILHVNQSITSVTEMLSQLLHTILDERMFISIDEEIANLKCYLGIQEYRYCDKFTSSFIIEEGVEKLYILKLLLQPLLENALIHGIAPMKGQGSLIIKIYKEENYLIAKIQDNGIGFDETQISDYSGTSGLGIGNTISRIKSYFGDDYGLSIISHPGLSTVVELKLPLLDEEGVKKYV